MKAGMTKARASRMSPGAEYFADRLNRLFATVYPPGRGPFRNTELAAWIESTGGGMSLPYLSQLRTGKRARPSQDVLELLADFFGIRVEYFLHEDSAYVRMLDTELDWLDVTHRPDVRRLTTMIIGLPTGTQAEILDFLEERKTVTAESNGDHDFGASGSSDGSHTPEIGNAQS